MQPVSIKFPPATLERLAMLAPIMHRTRSQLVRLAVQEYLRKYEQELKKWQQQRNERKTLSSCL